VADLRQAGVPEEAAVRDAIARLGDADTIARAVRVTRPPRRVSWQSLTRVAIAWIAVGAMSIVTLAAIELPQASSAKVSPRQFAPPTNIGIRGASGCGREHRPTGDKAKRGTHLPRAHRCA
jgi:hypothetical protein